MSELTDSPAFQSHMNEMSKCILAWEDEDDINIARDFGQITVEMMQEWAKCWLRDNHLQADLVKVCKWFCAYQEEIDDYENDYIDADEIVAIIEEQNETLYRIAIDESGRLVRVMQSLLDRMEGKECQHDWEMMDGKEICHLCRVDKPVG